MFDPSALLTLAEISVALAGFSAVVVLFKRRDAGVWAANDADRFHGMVLHAMAAGFFALLPSIADAFSDDPRVIWRSCSAVLGLQIFCHLAIIWRLSTTTRGSRWFLVPGVLAGGIQVGNVLGVAFDGEFAPYLVGVLWHVFQSGVLFVWLIWIPEDAVEPPAG